jgi:hypothetical protein
MQLTFPAGTQFANLAEIQEAVRAARADAEREARKACGRGTFVSRGSSFRGIDAKGDVVLGEAESWMWAGTGKALVEAIDEVRYDLKRTGAVALSIEGGFNFAENPRALADGEYDPWVSEWSVTVWKRG